MNIIGVVQARLGSERLPGKVLLPLADTTVIGYMLQRLKMCRSLSKIVVAVPAGEDALIEEVQRNGCDVYEGSEHDVLDRVYQAALTFSADYLVRFTGDCPLIDPALADAMVARAMSQGADYVGFGMVPTFPDGLGTEVVRFQVLQEAWKKAESSEEREHVTWYIRTQGKRFHIENYLNHVNLGRYRFTLDNSEDLNVICTIVDHFEQDRRRDYSFQDVVELIDMGACGHAAGTSGLRDEKSPNPVYYSS